MADQTIHEKSLLHIREEEIVQAPSPQDQASANSRVPMVSAGTNTSRASDELLSAATTGAEKHHQGIYWRSPIGMVSFLIFGVFASVSHHLYYSSLDGKKVGNDNDQQWALRWGTTFAYIVQTSLVCSTGFAFTQYLWMSLKKTKMSVKGLDAAFEANQTIVSAFNPEVLYKTKVVALLALIAAGLPLPSLVTPATLFVLPSLQTVWTNMPAPVLDMYSVNQTKLFTYSVPSNTSTGSGEQFLGPRTIISRLSTATATQGQILPVNPPSSNSSFEVQFYAPSVQCSQANSTVETTIDFFRNQSITNSTGNIIEWISNYFAFVPDLSSFGNNSLPENGVQMVDQMRPQQPTNASNQLWMVYSVYDYSTGQKRAIDHYTTCQLYNASYRVNLTFQDGNKTITPLNITTLNEVPYPAQNAPASDDLLVQHAYSAVMWALTELLTGSMGIFTEYSAGTTTRFGEITTQIEQTSLLGSSDLDVFFDNNHFLYSNSTINSDQRQQDVDLAQNRTLDILIPELAFNTTMSFMNDPLLSPSVPTDVLVTQSINTHAYHSRNLLLSYGLAIAFAVLANLLGAYAYWQNGHSHNKSFSAILASTRDPGLTKLFHAETMGRLPLHKNVQEAKLTFGITPGGWLGFWRV